MRRIILAVIMALALGQAREFDTGLAAVRQKLQGQPVSQRKLTAQHHRAAMVSATLADTAAALERSDGRDLGYLRERLLTASRSLEADFAAIETKLAGLGLPDKTAAWRDFVQHYRARLAEVEGELASLAVQARGLAREELWARMAALRAKVRGTGEPAIRGGVQGMAPWRTLQRAASASAEVPVPAPQAEAHATNAEDAPTPEDLAENKVVQLTPEIRARAQALNRDPAALNTWVATHIEYVPYFGQMQNSQTVLLSGRGNSFDQATLLVALLRASGIPARYVAADIALTTEEARNWMGVKDDRAAQRLLNRNWSYQLDGQTIVTGHIWVEANWETSSGKQWMALDPSRKRRSYQPGIELPRLPYDLMAYLRTLKPIAPAEPYLDALHAELQKTYPGRGFDEVPYKGTLLPPPAPAPASAYPMKRLRFRVANDRLGQRTAMTDPEGGITSYTYDANRRLTSVTTPGGAAVRFVYDAYGRMTTIQSPGGTTATVEYDPAGQIVGLAYASAAGGPPWAAFQYRYDKAGNRISMTDRAGWHVYQFDGLDRLVGGQHEAAQAESYTYDPVGNRAAASEVTYQYDPAGRQIAAQATQFTYDKNGNLTAKTDASGTTRYTWNLENQLVGVELPDGGVVRYRYDPLGRRIEKNVNGVVTTYLYDGNNVVAEMDAEGRVKVRYTHGPGADWPLALESEGQTWFYHADALGSVVALTDSSGTPVRYYTYDSWGRPVGTAEGGPPNPYLFAGREFDPETGFYHLRARYLDPALGRFISADPLDLPGLLAVRQSAWHEEALLPRAAAWALRGGRLGLMSLLGAVAQRTPQRLSPYAYAANNPLRFRDPSGMMLCHLGRNPLGDAITMMLDQVTGIEGFLGKVTGAYAAMGMPIPPELQQLMTQTGQLSGQMLSGLSQTSQQIQAQQAQQAQAQIASGLLDPGGGQVTLTDYLSTPLTGEAAALQQQVSNLNASYETLSNMMKSISDMQQAAIRNVR